MQPKREAAVCDRQISDCWGISLIRVCSLASLGLFLLSFLESDAFRFQPLLSAVRSTSKTSEHVCSTLSSAWRGHIFIFNLTATLLFLDASVQTIWPPALFTERKKEEEEKKKVNRKELTGSCRYLFSCWIQGEVKLAKFSLLSGPVSQIPALITGPLCGKDKPQ